MNLSTEQVISLRRVFLDRRQLTLTSIVVEVARHNLLPEVRDRHKEQMLLARPAHRAALLKEGLSAAKIVDEIGKALFNQSYGAEELVNHVKRLLALDQLGQDSINRVLTQDNSGQA